MSAMEFARKTYAQLQEPEVPAKYRNLPRIQEHPDLEYYFHAPAGANDFDRTQEAHVWVTEKIQLDQNPQNARKFYIPNPWYGDEKRKSLAETEFKLVNALAEWGAQEQGKAREKFHKRNLQDLIDSGTDYGDDPNAPEIRDAWDWLHDEQPPAKVAKTAHDTTASSNHGTPATSRAPTPQNPARIATPQITVSRAATPSQHGHADDTPPPCTVPPLASQTSDSRLEPAASGYPSSTNSMRSLFGDHDEELMQQLTAPRVPSQVQSPVLPTPSAQQTQSSQPDISNGQPRGGLALPRKPVSQAVGQNHSNARSPSNVALPQQKATPAQKPGPQHGQVTSVPDGPLPDQAPLTPYPLPGRDLQQPAWTSGTQQPSQQTITPSQAQVGQTERTVTPSRQYQQIDTTMQTGLQKHSTEQHQRGTMSQIQQQVHQQRQQLGPVKMNGHTPRHYQQVLRQQSGGMNPQRLATVQTNGNSPQQYQHMPQHHSGTRDPRQLTSLQSQTHTKPPGSVPTTRQTSRQEQQNRMMQQQEADASPQNQSGKISAAQQAMNQAQPGLAGGQQQGNTRQLGRPQHLGQTPNQAHVQSQGQPGQLKPCSDQTVLQEHVVAKQRQFQEYLRQQQRLQQQGLLDQQAQPQQAHPQQAPPQQSHSAQLPNNFNGLSVQRQPQRQSVPLAEFVAAQGPAQQSNYGNATPNPSPGQVDRSSMTIEQLKDIVAKQELLMRIHSNEQRLVQMNGTPSPGSASAASQMQTNISGGRLTPAHHRTVSGSADSRQVSAQMPNTPQMPAGQPQMISTPTHSGENTWNFPGSTQQTPHQQHSSPKSSHSRSPPDAERQQQAKQDHSRQQLRAGINQGTPSKRARAPTNPAMSMPSIVSPAQLMQPRQQRPNHIEMPAPGYQGQQTVPNLAGIIYWGQQTRPNSGDHGFFDPQEYLAPGLGGMQQSQAPQKYPNEHQNNSEFNSGNATRVNSTPSITRNVVRFSASQSARSRKSSVAEVSRPDPAEAREPGPLANRNEDLPKDIESMAIHILGLEKKNGFPSRKAIGESLQAGPPFDQNFTKTGYLRQRCEMLKYYGDNRLFSEEEWKYLTK